MADPEPQHPLPQSQPVGPRRIGIFPDSYATESTTLMLHDKWFSIFSNEYTITTTNNDEFLKILGEKGEYAAKEVRDMNGNLLYTVERKFLHFPAQYKWTNPQKEIMLEVKGEEHRGWLSLYKAKVKFRNAHDGQEIELELQGDANNRTGVINCGDMGTIIAIRQTKGTLEGLFHGEKVQEVTIWPFVDRVLAVGLVICINERWEHSEKEIDPEIELKRGVLEGLRDLNNEGGGSS